MTETEREKIGSYEEAFEKIKEETGVNSMHVKRKSKSLFSFHFFLPILIFLLLTGSS